MLRRVCLLGLLLALSIPAAGLKAYTSACNNATDCSLGGQCVKGTCRCSRLWQGARCEQLAIGEAVTSGNGYQNPDGASWGGSAIRDENGTYHLFVSYMSRDCGLANWKFNSVIHHAVSQQPEGPYKFKDEVFPAFAHNPTITRAPDGTYLLYHIGEQITEKEVPLYVKNCRVGEETKPMRASAPTGATNFDGRIRVAHSKSLDGPWKLLNDGEPILLPRKGSFWDTAVTNPAPVVLKNGSVLLYYRGDDRFGPNYKGVRHRKIGVAYADTWQGPYRRLRDHAVTEELGEDPVVFANADGSGFHMLFENKFQGIVGQHAFSPDGIQWTTIGNVPAYDLVVSWAGGNSTKLDRRERPQLLRDEQGEPLYLFNAVQGARGRGPFHTREQSTWTLVAPIGQKLPPYRKMQMEKANERA